MSGVADGERVVVEGNLHLTRYFRPTASAAKATLGAEAPGKGTDTPEKAKSAPAVPAQAAAAGQ